MGISYQTRPPVAEPGEAVRLAAPSLEGPASASPAGVCLSPADLKALLGIPGATDLDLAAVVHARLTRAQGASCGCGG